MEVSVTLVAEKRVAYLNGITMSSSRRNAYVRKDYSWNVACSIKLVKQN